MTISADNRFSKTNPCPICNGYDGLPRGEGIRCTGFISEDGRFAHCSREECANGATFHEKSETYSHFLKGPCACGRDHSNGSTTPIPVSKPTQQWIYTDADGNPLFQVRRYVKGGSKCYAQSRYDHASKDFKPGLVGTDRVLYRLPELHAADPSIVVWIPEGEKCAHALCERGLLSTTNPGGACKWHLLKDADGILSGRDIIILPDMNDADGKGERHGVQVAERMRTIGAKSVKVLRLPGLAEGGDVVDFFQAGGTLEQLLDLAKQCPTETAQDAPTEPSGETSIDGHTTPWETVIDLEEREDPTFPNDVFPGAVQAFVNATAESTQTPLELASLMALAVMATACQGKFRVSIKPDYDQPLNLFCVAVLPSGSRKSEVLSRITGPIEEIETQLWDDWKGTGGSEENPPKRLLTDDVTQEALASLLARNNERMTVVSDEANIFSIMAGRYSQGGESNFFLFLKAHEGSPVSLDRKHSKPIRLRKPCLTLALTVQPDVIAKLRAKPEFVDRGLLGRCLFVYPETELGSRTFQSKPVPQEVRDIYHLTILQMIDTPGATDQDGDEFPHTLTFADDAYALLEAYYNRCEEALAPGGEFEFFRSWGSKYLAAVCRIAGVLHCCRWASDNPQMERISAEDLSAAIRIGEALRSHALKTFGLLSDSKELKGAKDVLDWIREHAQSEFTTRDTQAKFKRRFTNADEVRQVLNVLAERGYIRSLQKKGRSEIWAVNPILL